ncbi:hypothetical protein FOB58_002356 [Candida parapsilosis]|uniref:Uncharacterized protein n=2 Tax=Candida parapsilosis TaxID=5480 RepID=G8B650_CANPC|nr:uncharacterized protein CPAR2_110170 [Candida parapsilosis]KAF6043343.1 hypothetical protein FOB59_005426 [Candida parapsilosis]KAF6049079.1 hypothetical protein FOB58_002356 [Candida parapsilosis]KAF6056930.1 hypothetical protein FOB60_001485 [Candida parapsilosis]KAF6066351.1 hypothetical protein FOB61_002421 [Candida parapsilosis]KAI5902741.1 hypothetical protein K4G60_g1885 [Candida parapsilosis]
MWKRLGFGDATITNEPTIDYNRTSSTFSNTPRKPMSSSRNRASRLLDDLSTPQRYRKDHDSEDDDDDYDDDEYNRYRFDYTRNLDFNAYDLDDDLRRDTELIGEWTRENSLRNKYSDVKNDKLDDTHYSLPLKFPGKYQTVSREGAVESKDKKIDSENRIDREINKLKREIQQEQQSKEDLMPGVSLVPQITELTTTVQNQMNYLSSLKHYAELTEEEDSNIEIKYQSLKQDFLQELVKMEKLYTCYYNLLEKYVDLKGKSKD